VRQEVVEIGVEAKLRLVHAHSASGSGSDLPASRRWTWLLSNGASKPRIMRRIIAQFLYGSVSSAPDPRAIASCEYSKE
jgi:hypothetical protein